MKMMKVLLPLVLASTAAGAADVPAAERTVVPLSDPGKPVRVKAQLLNGGITVRGYAGKDVVVEMRVRDHGDTGDAGERAGRYAGMKRLANRTAGLSIEEQNNVVEINIESLRVAADLVIQVPAQASLELSSVNSGAIVVEQIQGDIEAQNVNGPITLTGVSGSALANTTNGAVTVTFTRVAAGKAMSFVTLNGNVDVTLPRGTKADLNMSIANQGEIYTDFEIATKKPAAVTTESGTRAKDGRYVLKLDHAVRGAMNGGGAEFTLQTFNGDILLRESK